MTIFADYKLPQVLEQLGAIAYDTELNNDIMQETLIPAGSQKEIEIRANTIAACEQIVTVMREMGRELTVQEFDWILWVKSQSIGMVKPHHKTLTLFY